MPNLTLSNHLIPVNTLPARRIICDQSGAPITARAGMYEGKYLEYVPSEQEVAMLNHLRSQFPTGRIRSSPNGPDWQNVRFEIGVNS